MKQDEDERNYKKGSMLVAGRKLNGKSRFTAFFLSSNFYR